MTSETAIEVCNVSKRFRLKRGGVRTLKAAVIEAVTGRGRKGLEFWALRDVSFSVSRGETLGIVGPNGAGKSTILALISGTTYPTRGMLHVNGTVSSLLELGAGFHPDLTGRENVFLYGAIMGLSRRQMRSRFDEIVEFAELRDWIDQPVKHYSSGMYVRLGFAVAVEVDPDILIVDEVLAVGDAAFQKKCLERIADFKKRGKTMVVVSHDLGTIRGVSDRLLLLDHGQIVCSGDPEAVVQAYQRLTLERRGMGLDREWGTGEVRLRQIEFFGGDGEVPTDTLGAGGAVRIRIQYEATTRIETPVFGFAIFSSNGIHVYGTNTQIEGYTIHAIEGTGTLWLEIPALALAPGTYFFSFSVHSADHKTNYHRLDNRFRIKVVGNKAVEGCCFMPVCWRMQCGD
ncbi:MAG: ABC transporter ATP-binding protein [Kiritimatiellae bacterium]|nr:ABC transporter ATP-binding protein [Kiritimatiellia bacterium]